MMNYAVLLLLLHLAGALPAFAIQYFVDTAHPSASDANSGTSQSLPWKTIGKAARTVAAGDTVNVVPGSYDERVTVSVSGSSGSPITFLGGTSCTVPSTCPTVRGWTVSSGRSYVTISGFEVTAAGFPPDGSLAMFLVTGTDHVRIINNYLHDTCNGTIPAIGIRSDPNSNGAKATFLHIANNVMTNIGCPSNYPGVSPATTGRAVGVQCWCDSTLIENNDMSHTEDFVRTHGSYNVVRNNTFHDSYEIETARYDGRPGTAAHIDGWQSYCTGTNPATEAANYTLLEGNLQQDTPDTHSHFGLINDTDPCGGTTTIIVRGNIIHKVGSNSYVADDNNQSMGDNHKFYNNTVVTISSAANHVAAILTGVIQGSVLNNIFVDAVVDSLPYQGYALKVGDSTSIGDYNLFFMTSGSKTWENPVNAEAHHILNRPPLFVSSTDFRLQGASPAIQAGGPLTRVALTDGGNGTSLVVSDAHFFQDGWAGVSPDWIAVGNIANNVQIRSINYATNTITLAAPIARNSGQPVWLYKNSSGTVVLYASRGNASPDLGAVPAIPPAPPTNPRAIIQ